MSPGTCNIVLIVVACDLKGKLSLTKVEEKLSAPLANAQNPTVFYPRERSLWKACAALLARLRLQRP
jgi:hypothetical protein